MDQGGQHRDTEVTENCANNAAWIPVADRYPPAEIGNDPANPTISADVLVLFETGPDIANFDHDERWWSLPNEGFRQPDAEPLYWMPIPDFPTGYEVQT